MYHQQLSYCVTQFVEKDPKLAEQVLKSILQFWPRTFSAKEVLFLNEVRREREPRPPPADPPPPPLPPLPPSRASPSRLATARTPHPPPPSPHPAPPPRPAGGGDP